MDSSAGNGEKNDAADSTGDDTPKKKKKKKKKTKVAMTIITNLQPVEPTRERVPIEETNFGKLTKQKMSAKKQKVNRNKQLSKKEWQRSAGGAIDSSRELIFYDPKQQPLQVEAVKRGNKSVTIVRGMTGKMEERKKLLKKMKGALGSGGTLVDGVLEIQGSFADKILNILTDDGYVKARKVGK